MSTDGTGTATLSDQVIEEILGLMGRRRVNKAEMARRLGRKEDWVGRRLNGRQPIDLEDLRRFAAVLGVSAADLLPKGDLPIREYANGDLQKADRYLPGQLLVATIGEGERPSRPARRARPGNRVRPIDVNTRRPMTPLAI